jgi:uncharacterized membrane protein YhaH (DUF805 family)
VLSGAAILLALLAIPAAGSLGGLVLAPLLIGFVASLALVVRRLHDRDRSGWWLVIFCLLQGGLSELGDRLPHPTGGGITLAMLIVYLSGLGLSVWAWLEVGFLRGTRGVNRYGADAFTPTAQGFAQAPLA